MANYLSEEHTEGHKHDEHDEHEEHIGLPGYFGIVGILVVGALPEKTQNSIPLLPTLARPVKQVLPDRIQQRFHLWLDGFNPPAPETSWWKEDYDNYYKKLVEKDPEHYAPLFPGTLPGLDPA